LFRFYTIVGPKILRPNSEYHVAVSTQGTTSPTTVVVDVGGKQDSGGVLKVTQFVKVDPFSTRIVRLEVSSMYISHRPIFISSFSSGWLAQLKSKTKISYCEMFYLFFDRLATLAQVIIISLLEVQVV